MSHEPIAKVEDGEVVWWCRACHKNVSQDHLALWLHEQYDREHGLHKAAVAVEFVGDVASTCLHCHREVKKVIGGHGPVWVHAATGIVTGRTGQEAHPLAEIFAPVVPPQVLDPDQPDSPRRAQ